MNFNGIILTGIKNYHNNKDLKSYFVREYRIAQRDYFYDLNSFFSPLIGIAINLEKKTKQELVNLEEHYKKRINQSSKNELSFKDSYYRKCLDKAGINYEDYKKEQNLLYFNDYTSLLERLDIRTVKIKFQFNTISNQEVNSVYTALLEAKNELNHDSGFISSKHGLLNDSTDKANPIGKSLKNFFFFQIEITADLEYNGKTYKDVNQKNNDSILTPENWEQHKETFFIQRMATYKDSYTLVEKIKLELQTLETLPLNETDYQILKDRYIAYLEQKQTIPPQQINESPFSVLEWATIFYYADETKLLSESRTIKERIEKFISNHEINTTLKYFRTQYYEAKKRINEKNDYPINKLELIIPFLKENYIQTVTKVENDIIFLEGNYPEY